MERKEVINTMLINTQHPLYYNCSYNSSTERYGLVHPRDNCFYIIDNNFKVLKNVQLAMLEYELLTIVNIDHFFTFLSKTQKILDKYQIEGLTDNHNNHVARAAIINNTEEKASQIQKTINNDNCFLFGLNRLMSYVIGLDRNHYQLGDNIIKHTEKPKSFDSNLQEKLFLIRRLVYVLEATADYLTQFASLQENISLDGLQIYKEHFELCYPNDTKVSKVIERDIEIEYLRKETIRLYIGTVYKFINNLDLDQSIKNIILMLSSKLPSIADQTLLDNPTSMPSYESNRIRHILDYELNKILKNIYE